MSALNISAMILKIMSWVVFGSLCYWLGSSNKEVKIVTKEVEIVREVVKYETKEMSKIISKPNLADDDISRLFDTWAI